MRDFQTFYKGVMLFVAVIIIFIVVVNLVMALNH